MRQCLAPVMFELSEPRQRHTLFFVHASVHQGLDLGRMNEGHLFCAAPSVDNLQRVVGIGVIEKNLFPILITEVPLQGQQRLRLSDEAPWWKAFDGH